MQAHEFFQIFFQHMWLYAACIVFTTALCYVSIKRITIAGYLDPLHFYWTFTFGTAYGVVLGLFLSGYISVRLFSLVLSYSVILICSLYYFRHAGQRVLRGLSSHVSLGVVNLKLFTFVAFISYLFLAFFLVSKIGFGADASTNRFEQSRGYGAFVRISDALRLIVFACMVCHCMALYQSKKKKWLLLAITAFVAACILVFSSFLNGAKFALLEGEYVAFVLIAIQLGRPQFKLKIATVIFSISAAFAGVLLNINLTNNNQVDAQSLVASSVVLPAPVLPSPSVDVLIKKPNLEDRSDLGVGKRFSSTDTTAEGISAAPTRQSASSDTIQSEAPPQVVPVQRYLPVVPFLMERIILRVISNADKYYLALPNDVIDDLHKDSVLVRLSAPLIGSSRLSQWLGYDVNDFSVGRQALLHYDPNYKIAGGPTSHYDLFAYKYGTVYFGWIIPILIGLILSVIRSLAKLGRHNVFLALLASVLWVRALPMLLEPTMGIAYILDVFAVFSALSAAAWVLQKLIGRVSSGGRYE